MKKIINRNKKQLSWEENDLFYKTNIYTDLKSQQ